MPGKRHPIRINTDEMKKACDRFLKSRNLTGESYRQKLNREAERGMARRRAPRKTKIEKMAEEIEKESQ